MHIPDGVLDPTVCAVTGCMAAAAVGYSMYRLRDSLAERTIPVTGMTASLIFAAQMVNFPLVVAPVSGHLLGGVLASAILGPWGGCLALSMVLFVQVALFADGGWMSLGANIFNMGVIGCWGGSLILHLTRRLFRDPMRASVIGAIWGAWITVMLGAVAFCAEFAFSSTAAGYDLGRLFFMMLGFHALIGIGEAIITGLILKYLIQVRPDLVAGESEEKRTGETQSGENQSKGWIGLTVAGVILAVGIVVIAAPWASSHPDGLEAVGEQLKFNDLSKSAWSVWLEDYSLPWLSERWEGVGTALVGLVGTAVVFLLTILLTRGLKPQGMQSPRAIS